MQAAETGFTVPVTTAAQTSLPVDNEFQSPLTFATPALVNREATRYLFFAGDVISPRRRQERRDLAKGGEENFTPCLWRAKNVIRRGRITPLEYAARWDIEPRVPAGVRTIAVTDHGGNPTILEKSQLLGIPVYPGEVIRDIISLGDEGMPMGVVELRSLIGVEYDAIQREGYQFLFFPEYPNLPPTLRELVEQIRRVRSVESVVREMQADMLDSCSQFQLFGTQKVEQDHALMKQPTQGGHVFGYSPLSETLLPQLEIPRQDQGLQTMAQLTGKITEAVVNQQGPDYERIFSLMKDNQDALIASMAEKFSALLAEKEASKSTQTAEPVKGKVSRPRKESTE